jgi:UDP-glucose 4-epimerase
MSRVALVTGVSTDLGASTARGLAAEPDIDKVVGIDLVPPRGDLEGVKFVRADIRNPVVGKVLAVEEVDTVVHLSVRPSSGRGGRSSMKESNVIGTMQLLAACQRAAGVRKLVLKSSTEVYGASPRDPAMFTEDMAPRRAPRSGYAKDTVEVEGYVRGLARRRPDLLVTTLRMARLLSARFDSPLGRYLRMPVVPTVLGFDPRLQVVHDHDALAVLRRAVVNDIAGTFNVAGSGIVMLSQAVRRLGRPTIPVPPFGLSTVGQTIARTVRVDIPPDLVEFLTYGRGVDTTALTDTFGYKPSRTTAQTFDEFAGAVPSGVLSAERVRAVESRLAAMTRGGGGHGDANP